MADCPHLHVLDVSDEVFWNKCTALPGPIVFDHILALEIKPDVKNAPPKTVGTCDGNDAAAGTDNATTDSAANSDRNSHAACIAANPGDPDAC